jgi:Icc-related predicted phosphoesterase
MIAFIGDVHGEFGGFYDLFLRYPALMDADAVIQVGDFGLTPECAYTPPPRPVYWLDGNHEYYPDIADLTEPTEVRPNTVFVPRGQVLDLAGYRVGFLGGAESRDRHTRVEGVSWFPEESIRYADMLRFPADAAVDILASHTPPAHVVRIMLGRADVDPSAQAVEAVWDGLGRPLCVSGHMHERRTIGRCEVLGELDVLVLP